MHPSPRVLLVDDDSDFREAVRFLLEDAGYTVAEACDGHLALEIVEGFRPDLVLLDLTMPVMSGAEVLRELDRRGLRESFGVIAMSGAAAPSQSPTKWFLAKPVRAELLLAVAADFCSGYAASPLWGGRRQTETARPARNALPRPRAA
jgi:CheY-like chemotaxis protein